MSGQAADTTAAKLSHYRNCGPVAENDVKSVESGTVKALNQFNDSRFNGSTTLWEPLISS
jgi:hypothetical protein